MELFGLSMLYTFFLISIHSVGKYWNCFLQSWWPAWVDKTSRTLCMARHSSTKWWYYFADSPVDHSNSCCKSSHDGNQPQFKERISKRTQVNSFFSSRIRRTNAMSSVQKGENSSGAQMLQWYFCPQIQREKSDQG